MFIFTARVPRQRGLLFGALAVLALLAALLLLRGREAGAAPDVPCVRTNEERVAYLTSLGWDAAPEPIESLRLALPEELVEPYRSYNELQLRQGFDLTPLLGETLERYTYAIRNYPGHPRGCQADLYLHEGRIVAGDIVCTGADGFIAPLAFPAEQEADGRRG